MKTKVQKKLKPSSLYYIIPKNVLNILPEIEQAPPRITGFRISFLKEIISIIAFHVRRDEGDTPLKMEYLCKIIPKANQYIKYLIDGGIVKRNNNYSIGYTSYKYRFTPEYYSIYKILPVEDPKLIRRLQYKHLKRENSKKYPDQNKFIRNLTVDPEVLRFITPARYPDIDKLNYALASITRILNKDIYYSVDSTAGRYHSNLTNFPSNLRPYIRINGQALLNIDIKNSQPYFLTILLTDPGKAIPYIRSPKFALISKRLKKLNTKDVRLYASLVKTGQLYEYMQGQFKEYNLNYTRDEAKDKIFKILFSRNSIHNKQKEIFKQEFPNVYKRVCELKGYDKSKVIFEGYERLSVLLQTIESHLILNTILPRIYSEYPKTIAVSIHDSIMTGILTNDIKNVESIMNSELTEFVGISPLLKIEKN